jgi:hypothetical protein
MMEGFADIEGPVRIAFPWLWLIGAAAAAVLLAGLVALLLRRRRQTAAAPAVPRRSPLEVALERLGQLRAPATPLEADAFTVEVADIVRDYLEAALAVPAREQTSEEFLLALRDNPQLPAVLHQHMPDFLGRCDQVKFARQGLAGEQRTRLLETAEAVVEQTDRHLQQVRSNPLSPATAS